MSRSAAAGGRTCARVAGCRRIPYNPASGGEPAMPCCFLFRNPGMRCSFCGCSVVVAVVARRGAGSAANALCCRASLVVVVDVDVDVVVVVVAVGEDELDALD